MNFISTPLQPFGLLIEAKSTNAGITELSKKELLPLFSQYQLLVLRGFFKFKSADQFADYCESWGEVSIWPFGRVLELVEHDTPQDHIFDHKYVPLHWDGMYRQQVPEYQLFYCVEAPLNGQGGRTTFSNTTLALKNARDKDRELWNRATGIYTRKMEFYNSKTVSPVVTQHPYRGYAVIRYNEPHLSEIADFVNPSEMQFTGIETDEVEALHTTLRESLYSPENFYAHEWQSGDIVIADNFSLLHGREKYITKSPRHIRRVHVLSDPPLDNPGLISYQ